MTDVCCHNSGADIREESGGWQGKKGGNMTGYGQAVPAIDLCFMNDSGADIREESGGWQGKKGGEMTVDVGGQHVLERTSVLIDDEVNVEPVSKKTHQASLRPTQV